MFVGVAADVVQVGDARLSSRQVFSQRRRSAMSTWKFLPVAAVIGIILASANAAYALNPQPEPPNHNMPKIAVILPPSPAVGR